MKNNRARFPRLSATAIVFIFLSMVWGFVPEDLREEDPVRKALYSTEPFRQHFAYLPNPPLDAKQKLVALIQTDPQNAAAYKALAQINSELLDWTAAEMNFRQYVDKAKNKENAYSDLENFYRKQLKFDQEFAAILEHAKLDQPRGTDSSQNRGPYLQYHRALNLITKYGLAHKPEIIHQSLVQTYPDDSKVLMEYIRYELEAGETASAGKLLEQYKVKFPSDTSTYLRTRADLLSADKAFELLDQSYDPLWSMDLVRALDSAAIKAEKKGDYLQSLKQQIQKDPLDLNASTRLFYAYHLAGNLQEATNTLNDYRLLKDKAVQEKKSAWSDEELYVMARLQDLAMNLNEAARYYYALYGNLRSGSKSKPASKSRITADEALYGIFRILIAADERPVQIGAANIDFYRDIAAADRNPGVINGILSLILNGIDIPEEMAAQEARALGYFNRGQAHRLLKLVQKQYPRSKHLPAMYRDSLAIYQKYGMDQLIADTGEQFFINYRNTPEVFEVAIAVTDAYARMKQQDKEWKTYDFILPIAAERDMGALLGQEKEEETEPEYEDDSEYTEDEESEVEDYNYEDTEYDAPSTSKASSITYEYLLNRYINSLTLAKNYDAVLKLYRDQIVAHSDAEGLYVNFAAYLLQNQLYNEEAELYKKAIQQFQSRSWYEKLARWYLRYQRNNDFENISREIIDLFSGTDVSSYLDSIVNSTDPYRDLYISLNTYAHNRFPHNLKFVRNLRSIYSSAINPNWKEWEKLSIEYYFMDEPIRNDYLRWLAENRQLPEKGSNANRVEKRFDADVKTWRSHFEEALPVYAGLTQEFSSDRNLNIRTADLKRSLGMQNPSYYAESAALREHLAKINPADSSFWTTAGETLAEIEDYEKAKSLWENILKIDPKNPDRYLEVATIQWDYYLFDDALATIGKIRKIKSSPSLFAYEAGAIFESKRDYPSAISEYSKGLVDDSDSARRRLAELYRRQKLTPLVKTELQKHLKTNAQSFSWWIGVIHFYLDQNENSEAQELIGKAVSSMDKTLFLDASTGLKTASQRLGSDELREKIIKKQIEFADKELNRIYLKLELARFYESSNRKADADRSYEELYRGNPRSAGLVQEITAYYWRTEQHLRAFDVYKEAISASNAKFKKQYLKDTAEKYLELKQYDNALRSASTLLAEDRMDSAAFSLIAQIHAEKRDYSSLAGHYKLGLQNVKESQLSEDQKNQQTAALRRGIIRANVILKDYTAALDQYIEIINRDAESETLLRESAEFAAAHGITDRLLNYYQNTAAASPRDHRWPAILGKIHVFSGNFDQAISSFQAAIDIRPERVDLHERLADTYQRSGKYPEAITAYERLYSLTYKDKRWLIPMAELNARIGNQERALELYIQSLSQPNDLSGKFATAQKAVEWGMPKTAIQYGNAGLKLYYSDLSQWLPAEGLTALAEAQIQNGQPVLSFQTVHQILMRIHSASQNAKFNAEEFQSTDYAVSDVLIRQLPELVKKYLSGEQLQEMDAAVLAAAASADIKWKAERLLPFAQNSGLAHAHEQLLLQLAAGYYNAQEYGGYRNDLRFFYLTRHKFVEYAQWLEKEWRKNPAVESRGDLIQIAEAFRLANKNAEELRILREYNAWITSVGLQPEGVERYLELLYSGKHREELKKAAARADFTTVNFFISKKDKELISISIAAIGKNRPAVWQTTQVAMLGRELRDPEPLFDQSFRSVLDIRTIGDQLQSPSNEDTALLGGDWFYYGSRYGEYLSFTGKKDGSDIYLNSELEAAPARDVPHYNLALFYKNESQNDQAALEHFTLASVLDPRNSDYVDERARALHALGRKEEAVAEWKKLIEHRSVYSYVALTQAAVEFQFLEQVRKDIERFLEESIKRSGASGLTELIPEYLQTLNSETKLPLLKRWINDSPAPRYFGTTVLQSGVDRESQDAIYQEVSGYYKKSISGMAGQQARLSENELIEWTRNYAYQLLEWKEPARAAAAAEDALKILSNNDDAENRYQQSLILIKTRALVRTGKQTEAFSLIAGYARGNELPGGTISSDSVREINFDRYRRGYELLKEENANTEANQLLQEAYENLIASGQTSPANYTGLAGIKIEQGNLAEAVQLLNRMIFSEPENLAHFGTAAALLEEHKEFEQAIVFRRELERRKSWDMENRSLLANDLLQTGQKKDAAAIARRVLRSSIASIQNRVKAAEIYGSSANDFAGNAEMQQIEKTVRSQVAGLPTTSVYSIHLRRIAIGRLSAPSLDLLLAQLFVNPTDAETRRKLFLAYKEKGMCLQALQTIDPESTSFSTYETETRQWQSRLDMDDEQRYDPSEYYPIREWKLSDSLTTELALQAAQCAAELHNLQSQIFYLTMASTLAATDEKIKVEEQIKAIQEAIEEQQIADRTRWRVAENLGRES